jgi:hypothetical protein
MTKNIDPSKIAELLTLSARQLDEATLSALVNARQNALQRQSVRAPAFVLDTGRWTHSLIPHSIQQWALAGLLVAIVIVGTSYWHQVQEQQIDELDVAILTDDLPIEAFVD